MCSLITLIEVKGTIYCRLKLVRGRPRRILRTNVATQVSNAHIKITREYDRQANNSKDDERKVDQVYKKKMKFENKQAYKRMHKHEGKR